MKQITRSEWNRLHKKGNTLFIAGQPYALIDGFYTPVTIIDKEVKHDVKADKETH